MRLLKLNRLWLKHTAGAMLALFLSWSLIYSLHFLLAANHATEKSTAHFHDCSACHGLNFNVAKDENLLKAVAKQDVCLLCLFASELHNANTSAIFNLARNFSQATDPCVEFFTLLLKIEIGNFSRAPPCLIV